MEAERVRVLDQSGQDVPVLMKGLCKNHHSVNVTQCKRVRLGYNTAYMCYSNVCVCVCVCVCVRACVCILQVCCQLRFTSNNAVNELCLGLHTGEVS